MRYRVRVCGVADEVDAGALRLRASYGLAELTRADTIILPAGAAAALDLCLHLVRRDYGAAVAADAARASVMPLELETTSHSIEHIATEVGFGSVTALRDQFPRIVLTSPQAYRRSFQSKPLAGPFAS
jgi:transcriptional regulator GlxA family with amidase domain